MPNEISAEVISLHEWKAYYSYGDEFNNYLVTFKVHFPHIILPEVNRHRACPQNFSSSRAIPFEKLMREADFTPLYFGENQKGMECGEPLEEALSEKAKNLWNEAREAAIGFAQKARNLGVHKEWTNRLIEPFSWVTGVFTAERAGLENFFALRDSPKAQPEIRELAQKMKSALADAPRDGGYLPHIPFVYPKEAANGLTRDNVILSVARCCSVSYGTVKGEEMTIERARDLVENKLFASSPIHASPFEHQIIPFRGSQAGLYTSPIRYGRQLRCYVEMARMRGNRLDDAIDDFIKLVEER